VRPAAAAGPRLKSAIVVLERVEAQPEQAGA